MKYKNLRDSFLEYDDDYSYNKISLTGAKFEVVEKTSSGKYRVRTEDDLEILAYPGEIFYFGMEF